MRAGVSLLNGVYTVLMVKYCLALRLIRKRQGTNLNVQAKTNKKDRHWMSKAESGKLKRLTFVNYLWLLDHLGYKLLIVDKETLEPVEFDKDLDLQ